MSREEGRKDAHALVFLLLHILVILAIRFILGRHGHHLALTIVLDVVCWLVFDSRGRSFSLRLRCLLHWQLLLLIVIGKRWFRDERRSGKPNALACRGSLLLMNGRWAREMRRLGLWGMRESLLGLDRAGLLFMWLWLDGCAPR